MPPTGANGTNSHERKIRHSESFSHRVNNFNKLAGHSAVEICNDPDGFNKLSEETKKIKSRSNYITSALPPQVSTYDSSSQLVNTFRLQIHLPLEQLHVIRASPDDVIGDVLDIIRDERGLKLERYLVYKTNDPDLQLNLEGTLKEYAITELTLKLKPEFNVIRTNVSVNPKKVKKENSSHFKSAFKSFFSQLKPTSRSNSVTELRHTSDSARPRSEIATVSNQTEFAKPKAPPRKRTHAPPPPVQNVERTSNTMPLTRSHTASESSCESACEGSVGGSAPATLPRRCRLGPESVSTLNLSMEHPMPALRRGVSDLAVNKIKYPRRKRLAPRPPTLVPNEELKEDKIEEQAAQKTEIITDEITSSSHNENLSEEMPQVDNNLDNDKIVQRDMSDDISSDSITESQDNVLMQIELKHTELFDSDRIIPNEEIIITQKQETVDVNGDNDIKPFELEQENNVPEIITNGTEDSLPVIVQKEEKQITTDNQHGPIIFTQTNGQRLVLVDINIEDSVDPNDNNLDPHENRSSDSPEYQVDNNNELQHHSYVTTSNITYNENDVRVETPVQSNIDVQVEIHPPKTTSLKNNELNHDNDEPIEFRRALPDSQIASSLNVEIISAVEKPESKVLPSFPRTVASVSNRQSSNPPSSKIYSSINNKNPPQRSISAGSTIASKPTVGDLLKQIEKIKQKSAKKNNNDVQNETSTNKKLYGPDQPAIVGIIEKSKPVDFPVVNKEKSPTYDYPIDFTNNKESIDKPRENGAIKSCATPPVSPESELPPTLNGNSEEARSLLVTDVVAKLSSYEKQSSPEPVSYRPRPSPSFMLTSWAEEKRPPVVNRIAEYGSRSSVKVPVRDDVANRQSFVEKTLPSLTATLPRPFIKPIETTVKSSTVNRPPTIINVLEKSEVQKQNEILPSYVNGRQSAYAKLNLYNLTPKILSDTFMDNANATSVQKTSWELVQDASKKLQEKKFNGDHETDINDNHKNNINDNHKNNENGHYTVDGKVTDDKGYTNGNEKESETRHVYKYPKPLQFQLGTWNDKAKSLKIETEVKSEKNDDPPLVKEIDGVAVWSATY